MAKLPNGAIGQWIRFAGSAIIIPALISLLIWVIAVERRLTKIESNRFTSGDGLRLMETINQKADRDNVPPPEVRHRLDRLDKDIQEIKAMIRSIQ